MARHASNIRHSRICELIGACLCIVSCAYYFGRSLYKLHPSAVAGSICHVGVSSILGGHWADQFLRLAHSGHKFLHPSINWTKVLASASLCKLWFISDGNHAWDIQRHRYQHGLGTELLLVFCRKFDLPGIYAFCGEPDQCFVSCKKADPCSAIFTEIVKVTRRQHSYIYFSGLNLNHTSSYLFCFFLLFCLAFSVKLCIFLFELY